MSVYSREQLQQIKSFPSLVKYLHEELEWPITTNSFDDITFDYEPEELGIDSNTAAKIEQIKQLRPLITNQPWGIFFVKFEPKRLPVVALRRILSQLVIKKRTSAKKSEQASWNLHDLLFISNYGEGESRQITFAQFAVDENTGGSPVLRVLGWDDADTALHLDHVHNTLKEKLQWPEDTSDVDNWRKNWSAAFTLRHREVISTSKDLAESLAELAIRIRRRATKVMDIETEKGVLKKLYKAFQQALVHDLSEDDFADMYAQTITYGLLAARVSRPMGIVSDNLSDMIPITNPFLKDMLDTFLNVGGKKDKIDFDELGIQEVVELLNSPNTHIEAILRDFGNRTRQEDPVIHFYEFFLSAYDKKKKVERGVFYTPQPVVSFIVRSVHELLQTEFHLEDGLADINTWDEIAKKNKITIPKDISPDQPFVQILDPATGTATFLVEVIDLIYKTLCDKWRNQGKTENQIDIAWNDYVPKHLLPRLHGFELLMAPYAIAHMKIGLKLTETGYSFGSNERVHVYLTNTIELHSEVAKLRLFSEALAKEANSVNRIKKDKYFTVIIGNPPYSVESKNNGEWIKNLMEDYKKEPGGLVKLKEKNPKMINDDYVKFLRYGQYLIEKNCEGILAFINPHGYIDNSTFRGMRWALLKTFDKIKILDLHGNYRKKEMSIDGTIDENVFDIKQGVSINIFIKTGKKEINELCKVYHIDLFGKRLFKYDFLFKNNIKSIDFHNLINKAPDFYFIPKDYEVKKEYDIGFKLNELYLINSVGVTTSNDSILININKIELLNNVSEYYKIKPNNSIVYTIQYRPFDNQYIYFDIKKIGRSRETIMKNFIIKTNIGLVFEKIVSITKPYYSDIFVTNSIVDKHTLGGASYLSPLYLYHENTGQHKLDFGQSEIMTINPNLNIEILNKIAHILGLEFTPEKVTTKGTFASMDILDYIYAVLHSPTYRTKYNEFLKIDFPRVPYPNDTEIFWRLVKLGGELRQIHLLESPVVNKFITTYPVKGPDDVIKIRYENGKVWINNNQYFDKVPLISWEFYIGGYQPAQKWLKDRKGRVLSSEDIKHYQKVIVALSETDRIMKEIDLIDFM